LQKGEVLFRQGENGPLFHVKSGMLKVLCVHEDGNPVFGQYHCSGETIPHHYHINARDPCGLGQANPSTPHAGCWTNVLRFRSNLILYYKP
jgi:hypothetical protein